MKRIIAVLCLSAIMMGGLLAVDKVFHNPEEMYLRGNRHMAAGEYKKACYAYASALNNGGSVQSYGGFLAAHCLEYGFESSYRLFNCCRPVETDRDTAEVWWNVHRSMAGQGAVAVEKTEDGRYLYYDENHRLKAAEKYTETDLALLEVYDDRERLLSKKEWKNRPFSNFSVTDYTYENNLLAKEETIKNKGTDSEEKLKTTLYFYDENNNLTEEHRISHTDNEKNVYIYNIPGYPLAVKRYYPQGGGSIDYYSEKLRYSKPNVKTEYYNSDWQMEYYVTYQWLEEESGLADYSRFTDKFGYISLVHRQNRYSPDGTYLGATADVYNGFGSWWGYICFDSKNRVTETVGKYEYLLRE